MQIDEAFLNQPAADPSHWLLEPALIFLNHGAFGACPRPVLEQQTEWRRRVERQPLQFLVRELEEELAGARGELARFIGAETEDIVWVNNATSGVNTVLRSLDFGAKDELLVTNHAYNACRNAVDFIAERTGAQVIVAPLAFPFRHADELVAPILAAVTPRTRLVLLDHVSSQTGIVMPIKRIVMELNRRGVETLVDGAHAPGMVALNLRQLGATYYTGNCHKWLCAPKSAAFLYVRREQQKLIRPLTISHGAKSAWRDRSRFQLEFGWPGTWDVSAALSVPAAIRFMNSLMPGGWTEVMARNRALALGARKLLCQHVGVVEPCPDEFIGLLAAVPLPDASPDEWPQLPFNEYPLQDALRVKHQIEVPIIAWPAPPKRWLRISAQLYNALPQYEALAKALAQEMTGI